MSNISKALAELSVPNTPPIYWISSFAASVERKYLNDSYSYGNVFSFDIEGKTYDNNTQDRISLALFGRINNIAAQGNFKFKIKSLTFPNSPEEGSDGLKILKFSARVDFEETVPSAHGNFIKKNGAEDFLEPIGPALIANGDLIKDYSETFNFDESEDGNCTFTHSANLNLIREEKEAGLKEILTEPNSFSKKHSSALKSKALEILNSAKNYDNFKKLTGLFTGQGFKFANDNWQQHFISDFDQSFTLSETFNVFEHSYSLTRSKKYFNQKTLAYFINFSYDLNIGSDGIVEITEKAEMKGNKTFAALKAAFNSDIEGPNGQYTYEDSTFKVQKSYTRCNDFLRTYKKFLRKTNSEPGPSGYGSTNHKYSLRPVPIERNFSSIPELPAIIHTVKYSANPNLEFGYESQENVKISKEGVILNVLHSFDLKSLNFRTGDMGNFTQSFGQSAVGKKNFEDFMKETIKNSKVTVHKFMNGSGTISFANLRPDPQPVGLALISKSFQIQRRGKNFNLTLEYSNDNKYAPLYYNQNPAKDGATAPHKGFMFDNLLIPRSVQPFLADNFSFFNKKVEVNIPVEKFTEKIPLKRSQAETMIEPSVNSTTGKMKIIFEGKVNKKGFDNLFTGGKISLLLGKMYDIRKQFFTSALIPIFDAAITAEIGNIIGGAHSTCGYVPSSMSYSFDSNFDFSINAEVEFYSRSIKRKPIFGFKGNKIYPGNIDTASIFGQESYS